MKILEISDVHGLQYQINDADMVEADVLVVAGDVCNRGDIHELAYFVDWLQGYRGRYDKILMTGGNHDRCLQHSFSLSKGILEEVPNLKLLMDDEYVHEGVRFYGSPWQPEFCNWAFNLPRGAALREKWSQIPIDTNVLITHGPPFGILDWCDSGNVGCEELRKKVDSMLRQSDNLKLHIFGHIHESYGSQGIFHNASICDGSYNPINKPRLTEI